MLNHNELDRIEQAARTDACKTANAGLNAYSCMIILLAETCRQLKIGNGDKPPVVKEEQKDGSK